MEVFIQQIVNGLFLGSVYALMALGYTMVYGIIKLINFAHGEIYMIGSFIGYFLINQFNMGFFPALVLSMAGSAILGVVIEFLAYRPLRNSTRIAALITAIGVSYLLQNTMIYFFSSTTRPFPQAIKLQVYKLGFLSISNIQLLILGLSLFLMIALNLIVQKTKMGKAMRAVSVDTDAAQLMGIDVNRTISFTFALGSALAAAGGMMIGLYYNSIDPMMGYIPGLKSFIAAVLGGIGIIPGAAIGGFVIGLIETLTTALGFSDFKDAVVYAVLILILLIRPAGILGKHVKAIATLGVAEIIRILLINFKEITNGPSGLFGIEPFVDWQMVYGFMAITTLFIVNYIRSGAGRATMAIREDEIAAEAMGVNTTKYKVMAFAFGAMTASIAGSLYAGYLQSIAPKDFAFTKSVDILILVVLGGIGSVTGTFIAAILLGIINMYLQDFGTLRMIIYALALIILMIFKPGGLLGTKELSVKKILDKFKKGDDQNASVGN